MLFLATIQKTIIAKTIKNRRSRSNGLTRSMQMCYRIKPTPSTQTKRNPTFLPGRIILPRQLHFQGRGQSSRSLPQGIFSQVAVSGSHGQGLMSEKLLDRVKAGSGFNQPTSIGVPQSMEANLPPWIFNPVIETQPVHHRAKAADTSVTCFPRRSRKISPPSSSASFFLSCNIILTTGLMEVKWDVVD